MLKKITTRYQTHFGPRVCCRRIRSVNPTINISNHTTSKGATRGSASINSFISNDIAIHLYEHFWSVSRETPRSLYSPFRQGKAKMFHVKHPSPYGQVDLLLRVRAFSFRRRMTNSLLPFDIDVDSANSHPSTAASFRKASTSSGLAAVKTVPNCSTRYSHSCAIYSLIPFVYTPGASF